MKVTSSHARAGASNLRESFAAIYDEYMPRVYRYVSYRVNSTACAEDLTSMIFEKALQKFNQYRPEKGAISTWLFAIARNTVIDYYRIKHGSKTVPLQEWSDVSGNSSPVEEEFDRRAERIRLKECLSLLSPKEQEIVALKFGSEQKNRQIAASLNISESNVGTIVYRAIQQLRKCFQEAHSG
ncbi:MAG: sigma-70 family RNA polymerase sigma factor [Dehalococcoidales bacterium]